MIVTRLVPEIFDIGEEDAEDKGQEYFKIICWPVHFQIAKIWKHTELFMERITISRALEVIKYRSTNQKFPLSPIHVLICAHMVSGKCHFGTIITVTIENKIGLVLDAKW